MTGVRRKYRLNWTGSPIQLSLFFRGRSQHENLIGKGKMILHGRLALLLTIRTRYPINQLLKVTLRGHLGILLTK
jgi:hypothetical protein